LFAIKMGGGMGLILEALKLFRIQGRGERQHFERYAPAE
jgi:hypothetical protein